MNTDDYLPSLNVAWSRRKNFFLGLEKRDQEIEERMEMVLGRSEMEQ